MLAKLAALQLATAVAMLLPAAAAANKLRECRLTQVGSNLRNLNL